MSTTRFGLLIVCIVILFIAYFTGPERAWYYSPLVFAIPLSVFAVTVFMRRRSSIDIVEDEISK
jgi:O-antigen/teichoic acid export membrane protein